MRWACIWAGKRRGDDPSLRLPFALRFLHTTAQDRSVHTLSSWTNFDHSRVPRLQAKASAEPSTTYAHQIEVTWPVSALP